MNEKILNVKNRIEFRQWLIENSQTAKECFVVLKRGKPKDDGNFYYLDAIEEVLCFGWIDSVLKNIDGQLVQRFSPRTKSSPWTELNKERVRRLTKLGLMTQQGKDSLPKDFDTFTVDKQVEDDIKRAGVWEIFCSFPPLYQRIRAYNLAFMRSKHPSEYLRTFENFIQHTKENKLYGEWNDYGRLLDY